VAPDGGGRGSRRQRPAPRLDVDTDCSVTSVLKDARIPGNCGHRAKSALRRTQTARRVSSRLAAGSSAFPSRGRACLARSACGIISRLQPTTSPAVRTAGNPWHRCLLATALRIPGRPRRPPASPPRRRRTRPSAGACCSRRAAAWPVIVLGVCRRGQVPRPGRTPGRTRSVEHRGQVVRRPKPGVAEGLHSPADAASAEDVMPDLLLDLSRTAMRRARCCPSPIREDLADSC